MRRLIVMLCFVAVTVCADPTNTNYRSVTVGADNIQTGGWVRLSDNGNWFNGVFTAGTNYGWEDLRFPAIAQKVGATNIPTFQALTNGVYAYAFSGSAANEIYGWAQLPHSWRVNSTIYPHLHILPSTGSTNWAVWVLEYAWYPWNTNTVETKTITITNQLNGTGLFHSRMAFGSVTSAVQNASSMFGWRVSREPTDDGDSYADAIYMLEFDIHYQIKNVGGELGVQTP